MRRTIPRASAAVFVAVALAAAAYGGSSSDEAARRVTLALDKAPLTKLAAELTRQSGVRHQATGDEAQRQLVVIFCKDREAKEVREAVTSLLGWTWSARTVDRATVYGLVKPYALRRLEEELRARSFRQYASVVRGMIAAALDPEQ